MTLKSLALSTALALLLPVSAQACSQITHYFDLCSEGTPWADGVWEQGGDSATLYLGEIGFEGYEQYIGADQATTLEGALTLLLQETAENRVRTNHLRDAFTTADLTVVRSIDTSQYRDYPARIWVLMIAEAPDTSRIELSVRAPVGTDIAELDRLSRSFAALVRRTDRKTD